MIPAFFMSHVMVNYLISYKYFQTHHLHTTFLFKSNSSNLLLEFHLQHLLLNTS